MTDDQFIVFLSQQKKGSPYLPEANAYFAAMSVQPDDVWKIAANKMIGSLKTESLWTLIDFMQVYRCPVQDGSLVNLKNPAVSKGTIVGSPTFTAGRGWTNNSTTGFINTQWAPADGPTWALNNCSATVYADAGTNTASAQSVLFGASEPSLGHDVLFQCRRSGDDYLAQMNDSGAIVATTNSTRYGLYTISKDSGSITRVYKNGSLLATNVPGTNTNITSVNLAIGGRMNSTETAIDFESGTRVGLLLTGTKFSAAQAAAFDTIWDTFVAETV